MNAETGKPISAVTVQLEQHTEVGVMVLITETDANGMFSFDSVPQGTWTLVVSYPGFQTEESDLNLSGPSSSISVGSIHLQFDYCATTPPCGGHGTCNGGTVCICEGYTGVGCTESILPPECASHRGFTEDVINSVLIASSLNKNEVKLNNLLNDLMSLSQQLPAYQSNSCCGGNDGYTYPVDVSMVSTASYAFLQEVMQFNTDLESFLEELV